jgi:phosphatidylserine/phosphatidylglycerophosphate/cardiolipin synthase-like enzyme
MMRGLSIVVLLVIVLPITQPGPSSPGLETNAGTTDLSAPAVNKLIISEVCPGRPTEYVVLTNGGEALDLRGMVITDGEGNLTIVGTIMLEKDGSIGLAVDRNTFGLVRPGVQCVEKGDPGLQWGGRFAIADAGDEVLLLSPDGRTVDVLVFGTGTYTGPGWTGRAVGSVPRAHAMNRCGFDTDTAGDWTIEPPGRSHYPITTFEAVVEPFSIPESGVHRIARELSLAGRSVNCSVYEISNPEILGLLVDCVRRGVVVNVLIEGQPVGGLDDRSKDAIATLSAGGVEVREMRSLDSYKRYDYLHSKYIVVDGQRVLITSENWGSGLEANRGWGVTLDGGEAGRYFDQVFWSDFIGALDVVVPKSVGELLQLQAPAACGDEGIERYRCQVSTLLSPDHAAKALRGLIDQAKDTILVEQLSIDKDWLEGSGMISPLLSAASRGVKVRVLLDSSWGGANNLAVVEELNRLARVTSLDLEARMVSSYHNFSVMHNKGLVIDDIAIVSSINWGDSALYQNREVGVAVRSEPISSFFRSLFWQDWSLDPVPPIVVLPWTYLQVRSGDPVLLDASSSTDNAQPLVFSWDIDGDGVEDSKASTWTIRLPVGNHTITLSVQDMGNNTATAICWVEVLPDDRGSFDPAPMAVVPVLVTFVVMLLKRIISRKRN